MKFAALSIGLLAAGAAWAGEEKIEIKDLPGPVLAAVRAKFPEAKVAQAAREEEDGKTVYEVAIKDGDAAIDLTVSARGKVLEAEKSIAPGKLPDAVTAAVEAKYPKAKIRKAEQVVKYTGDEEEETFEVVLAAPGEEDVEVKLSPKGKILAAPGAEKVKEEDDDDKDGKKAKADKKEGKKKGKGDEKS